MNKYLHAFIGYILAIALAFFAYDQLSEFYLMKDKGVYHVAQITEKEHTMMGQHANYRYTAISKGNSYTLNIPFYKDIGDKIEFFHVPGMKDYEVLWGSPEDSGFTLVLKNKWYAFPFTAAFILALWLISTVFIWCRHNKRNHSDRL